MFHACFSADDWTQPRPPVFDVAGDMKAADE